MESFSEHNLLPVRVKQAQQQQLQKDAAAAAAEEASISGSSNSNSSNTSSGAASPDRLSNESLKENVVPPPLPPQPTADAMITNDIVVDAAVIMMKSDTDDDAEPPTKKLKRTPSPPSTLADAAGITASVRDENKSQPQQNQQCFDYVLIGVTVHTGTSEAGHYYAYILDVEADVGTGGDSSSRSFDNMQWLSFNDTEVRRFDRSCLANEAFGGNLPPLFTTARTRNGGFDGNSSSLSGGYLDLAIERCNSAYMLFYEREDVFNERCVQLRAAHDKEKNNATNKFSPLAPEKPFASAAGAGIVRSERASRLRDRSRLSNSNNNNAAVSASTPSSSSIMSMYIRSYMQHVPPALLSKLLADNRRFTADLCIFDRAYTKFLYRFCSNALLCSATSTSSCSSSSSSLSSSGGGGGSRAAHAQQQVMLATAAAATTTTGGSAAAAAAAVFEFTGNDGNCQFLATRIAVTALLETLVHSRDRHYLVSFFDLVAKCLMSTSDSSEWFLEQMLQPSTNWLLDVLIRCPILCRRDYMKKLIIYAFRSVHGRVVRKLRAGYVLQQQKLKNNNPEMSNTNSSNIRVSMTFDYYFGFLPRVLQLHQQTSTDQHITITIDDDSYDGIPVPPPVDSSSLLLARLMHKLVMLIKCDETVANYRYAAQLFELIAELAAVGEAECCAFVHFGYLASCTHLYQSLGEQRFGGHGGANMSSSYASNNLAATLSAALLQAANNNNNRTTSTSAAAAAAAAAVVAAANAAASNDLAMSDDEFTGTFGLDKNNNTNNNNNSDSDAENRRRHSTSSRHSGGGGGGNGTYLNLEGLGDNVGASVLTAPSAHHPPQQQQQQIQPQYQRAATTMTMTSLTSLECMANTLWGMTEKYQFATLCARAAVGSEIVTNDNNCIRGEGENKYAGYVLEATLYENGITEDDFISMLIGLIAESTPPSSLIEDLARTLACFCLGESSNAAAAAAAAAAAEQQKTSSTVQQQRQRETNNSMSTDADANNNNADDDIGANNDFDLSTIAPDYAAQSKMLRSNTATATAATASAIMWEKSSRVIELLADRIAGSTTTTTTMTTTNMTSPATTNNNIFGFGGEAFARPNSSGGLFSQNHHHHSNNNNNSIAAQSRLRDAANLLQALSFLVRLSSRRYMSFTSQQLLAAAFNNNNSHSDDFDSKKSSSSRQPTLDLVCSPFIDFTLPRIPQMFMRYPDLIVEWLQSDVVAVSNYNNATNYAAALRQFILANVATMLQSVVLASLCHQQQQQQHQQQRLHQQQYQQQQQLLQLNAVELLQWSTSSSSSKSTLPLPSAAQQCPDITSRKEREQLIQNICVLAVLTVFTQPQQKHAVAAKDSNEAAVQQQQQPSVTEIMNLLLIMHEQNSVALNYQENLNLQRYIGSKSNVAEIRALFAQLISLVSVLPCVYSRQQPQQLSPLSSSTHTVVVGVVGDSLAFYFITLVLLMDSTQDELLAMCDEAKKYATVRQLFLLHMKSLPLTSRDELRSSLMLFIASAVRYLPKLRQLILNDVELQEMFLKNPLATLEIGTASTVSVVGSGGGNSKIVRPAAMPATVSYFPLTNPIAAAAAAMLCSNPQQPPQWQRSSILLRCIGQWLIYKTNLALVDRARFVDFATSLIDNNNLTAAADTSAATSNTAVMLPRSSSTSAAATLLRQLLLYVSEPVASAAAVLSGGLNAIEIQSMTPQQMQMLNCIEQAMRVLFYTIPKKIADGSFAIADDQSLEASNQCGSSSSSSRGSSENGATVAEPTPPLPTATTTVVDNSGVTVGGQQPQQAAFIEQLLDLQSPPTTTALKNHDDKIFSSDSTTTITMLKQLLLKVRIVFMKLILEAIEIRGADVAAVRLLRLIRRVLHCEQDAVFAVDEEMQGQLHQTTNAGGADNDDIAACFELDADDSGMLLHAFRCRMYAALIAIIRNHLIYFKLQLASDQQQQQQAAALSAAAVATNLKQQQQQQQRSNIIKSGGASSSTNAAATAAGGDAVHCMSPPSLALFTREHHVELDFAITRLQSMLALAEQRSKQAHAELEAVIIEQSQLQQQPPSAESAALKTSEDLTNIQRALQAELNELSKCRTHFEQLLQHAGAELNLNLSTLVDYGFEIFANRYAEQTRARANAAFAAAAAAAASSSSSAAAAAAAVAAVSGGINTKTAVAYGGGINNNKKLLTTTTTTTSTTSHEEADDEDEDDDDDDGDDEEDDDDTDIMGGEDNDDDADDDDDDEDEDDDDEDDDDDDADDGDNIVAITKKPPQQQQTLEIGITKLLQQQLMQQQQQQRPATVAAAAAAGNKRPMNVAENVGSTAAAASSSSSSAAAAAAKKPKQTSAWPQHVKFTAGRVTTVRAAPASAAASENNNNNNQRVMNGTNSVGGAVQQQQQQQQQLVPQQRRPMTFGVPPPLQPPSGNNDSN